MLDLLRPQALPDDKKPLSAELFWVAFRLHAGLPLSPRDVAASGAKAYNKDEALVNLFRESDGEPQGNKAMALLILCSFAEGSFTRPRTKKPKVKCTSD